MEDDWSVKALYAEVPRKVMVRSKSMDAKK